MTVLLLIIIIIVVVVVVVFVVLVCILTVFAVKGWFRDLVYFNVAESVILLTNIGDAFPRGWVRLLSQL